MSSQPVISHKHLEKNPIGLSEDQVRSTVDQLDRLVSSMFIQFHQYQKHHWLVEGPQFRDLHLYLEEAYTALHKELDAIAERMTVIGVIPSSSPVSMSELSFLDHEPEGVFPIREMLENDLNNERQIAEFIRKIIPDIAVKKDFATETLVKQTLVAVEERAHHLDHYLAGFTLEPDQQEVAETASSGNS